MSFTALQGATLISAHCGLTKVIVSMTYRVYNYIENDEKKLEKFNGNFHLQEFRKAIENESEFCAFLAAPLFYLSFAGVDASLGATLAAAGQIGYVWMRTAIGYPKIPTIACALLRYGGMLITFTQLWKLAFPGTASIKK
mmetsp:Transcript_96554/g.278715  ORF Transcript_96554/g.278715 Transcript_96554/m.278715 type:complete len:140 (-) Transcript_96554:137-556(-)